MKNEAPVIARCLTSVLPVIAHWVIVDTGSSDATMAIIRETLRDVPGDLYAHPWVDFATNRTQALDYLRTGSAGARGCDYALLMDADHVLGMDPGFLLGPLAADGYLLELRYGGTTYLSKRLIRCGLPWRYVGVLHEYLTCDVPTTEDVLPGLFQVPYHDGARARDPRTYRRDALTLEAALLDEPDNARYVFYLAQTYRDAGDPERAISVYRRRVAMGGWREEVWCALYQVARLRDILGHPWAEVAQDYLAAYAHTPDRAEPLYWLGLHSQHRRDYPTARLYLTAALGIGLPTGNRLFVETTLYTTYIPLECSVAAYWCGDDATALALADRLLASGVLSPALAEQVTLNRRFSLERVGAR